jgi:hypothetical protein
MDVGVALAMRDSSCAAAVDGDDIAVPVKRDINWAAADEDILRDVVPVQKSDSAHWETISSNSAQKRDGKVVSRAATALPFHVKPRD